MTRDEAHRLSDAARSVWGKSAYDDNSTWLPLWRHLADSAAVAGRLWDEWLPSNIKARIASELPERETDGRLLCTWLAGIHDVGKATPAFAWQVPWLADRMRDRGFHFSDMVPADRRMAPHATAGMVILDRWFSSRHGWMGLDSQQFSIVVGGHHGLPPTESELLQARRHPYLLGFDSGSGALWVSVQTEFLDWAAARLSVDSRIPAWRDVRLSQPVQAILTGLVITADWIASNDELFPYDIAPDTTTAERIERAWDTIDLPTPWRAQDPPDGTELFGRRFELPVGASIRPVQAAAIATARHMPAPGLMIVEAPMGEGKTEAALAAAEILAARTGSGGCLIALPTRATSDAMFSRVLSWLERLPDADVSRGAQSVVLSHGKAFFTPEFRNLLWSGRPSGIAIGEGGADLGVHPWTRGRKKAMLTNFVIGTIDQFLFTSLKAKHLALRHLGLAGKVVVIDEAHAYDVYMSSYLDKALEWMAAAGVPVIILSATLPAARRKAMIAAYDRGLTGPAPKQRRRGTGEQADLYAALEGDIGYPVLTATGPDQAPLITVAEPSGRQQTVNLERLSDAGRDLADMLRHRLENGGCALVVRNTVRRVQETAALLRAHLPGWPVTVAHSRFMALDRSAKDQWLRDTFGPPDKVPPERRPHRHIVVASQVAEQSLDIDFDLLVTDLAPIDLVLQRMGRLHRHERPQRIDPARCYVTGADWITVPPEPIPGSQRVYERYTLLRAAAVLWGRFESGTPVRLPDDIAPLVQDAYGGEPVGPASWRNAIDEAHERYVQRMASKDQRSKVFQIRSPDPAGEPLLGWLRADATGADRDDEDSPQGRAHVRDDSAETLEVLALVRQGGRLVTPPWIKTIGGLEVPTEHMPEPSLASKAAQCSLVLPVSIPVQAAIDQLKHENDYPAWEQSHMLSGQLVLVLDEDGRAELAGHRLRYDPDDGLEVTRTT